MSSVGFGLSPASGRGIAELAKDGRCSFADLSALSLGRFADTPPDWREQLGWTAGRASLAEHAATDVVAD
jgi:sarcosine oxidase subunit beta